MSSWNKKSWVDLTVPIFTVTWLLEATYHWMRQLQVDCEELNMGHPSHIGIDLGTKNQFFLLLRTCHLFSYAEAGIDELFDHRSEYLGPAQHLHTIQMYKIRTFPCWWYNSTSSWNIMKSCEISWMELARPIFALTWLLEATDQWVRPLQVDREAPHMGHSSHTGTDSRAKNQFLLPVRLFTSYVTTVEIMYDPFNISTLCKFIK